MGKILVSLELFNGKRFTMSCTAYLRGKSHCEMPALNNEQRTASKCRGMARVYLWQGSLVPIYTTSNVVVITSDGVGIYCCRASSHHIGEIVTCLKSRVRDGSVRS